MGMYMTLRSIHQGEVSRLIESPSLIWGVMGQPEPPAQSLSQKPAQGFWARMFGRKEAPASPAPSAALPPAIEPSEEIDLDKAWHVMHFVLTRSAWEGDPPMNFLLLGGTAVGDIDVGYGPARVLTPLEVKQSLGAVSSLTDEVLRSRYDVKALAQAEVYPSIWDDPEPEDADPGWIIEHMAQLKEFLASAAARNDGVVISLS